MIVTDNSWYVVRNTPRVTGFVGAGTTPVPLDKKEVDTLFERMGVAEPKYKMEVKAGDVVRINEGPFKDFEGSDKCHRRREGQDQDFDINVRPGNTGGNRLFASEEDIK